MSILLIIVIVFTYFIIGRIFAQIYVNIEGWTSYFYDDEILWTTIFWPIILPYWLFSLLIEWIDDNFF